MIGDVNLFLNDPDDSQCGEIEIMIAEPVARQKGFGIDTLYTFFRYGDHFYSFLFSNQLQ